MAKKELFNNDLDPDSYDIFESHSEAQTASVQTALDNLQNVLITDQGDNLIVDEHTELEPIEKACNDLKKAIRGKFVSRYILSDIEDDK